MYEHIMLSGEKFINILNACPDLYAQTVVLNGVSKAYAMTGWRLGYAACPSKEVAKAISAFQSHSTSNPTSFAQAGGLVALDKGDPEASRMCAVYEKRRDLFHKKLSQIKSLKPFLPQGAFYLFVNISSTGLKASALAQKLLEEAHVAVVPGEPFGSASHIRMSFATSEAKLEEAGARLKTFFEKV